jgi:hypothetical protein
LEWHGVKYASNCGEHTWPKVALEVEILSPRDKRELAIVLEQAVWLVFEGRLFQDRHARAFDGEQVAIELRRTGFATASQRDYAAEYAWQTCGCE